MSDQIDIDDKLYVTRAELSEVVALLTQFTQHAVLLSLHAGGGAKQEWKAEMEEMQRISAKLEQLVGAPHG